MEDVHSETKKLHIAMYPWFAFGHLIPFLQFANKLASKGHKISFILPKGASSQLASRNRYPNHITFIPLTLITIDGLPLAAETLSERDKVPLLLTAMDLTQPTIDSLLSEIKPDIVLFDFTYWLPHLAREHKVKAIYFCIAHIALLAYTCSSLTSNSKLKLDETPSGFPCSRFRLEAYEAENLDAAHEAICGLEGLKFLERVWKGIKEADAICFKGSKEMDGHYGEYFEKHYGKPVIWAGPGVPEPQLSGLEEKMTKWLQGFEKGSVVYCALGSESVLQKDQFQELLLGLELTGLPFLVASKTPPGYDTIESALPEGFAQRTKDRGAIHSWVQQELILKHPSIGCFVTHCGSSSLTESLVSDCRLVLLPMNGDHAIHARVMSLDLKVGFEVKRRNKDGFFTKEDVHEAIMKVNDPECEVGDQLRKNHAKWRELMLNESFEEFYINSFVQAVQNLLE